MRHGSLFNGIGGFQLAAEWMGWENVFSCEIDKFCNKVTKYHFPNCIQHEDIRTTDFSIYRGAIDIVTGGFPCQPYSAAGKREGKEDERHLWPEMLRAIREIQPSWIICENVPGLLNWKRGMVLHEIKTDLEAEGFEVLPPLVLPACGKNSPHRRDRLWVLSHSASNGCKAGSQLPIRQKVRFAKSTSDRNIRAQWQSQPGVCGVVNGIPNRVDRIKALGNAIVPQVAYEIFKAIELVEMTEASQGTVKKEQTAD